MAARRTPRHGRSRLLTPEVEARIIEAVRLGVPAELAAQAGGVSRSVLFLWVKQGAEESDRREEADYTPDQTQQPYVDLFHKITEARASAAIRNLAHIQKAAAGGYVVEETTEVLPDGREVTHVKKAGPDWRAAAWYLERQHRPHFGKEPVQVEVNGALGSAELTEKDQDAIAARVAANMRLAAQAATMAALPAGDEPIDAEIVDDPTPEPTAEETPTENLGNC